jgi:hypothetical protein
MLKKLHYRLEGITPLIMHNPQLADPLNAYTKAIKQVSGKRKKVDSDFEEMAKIEFLGGLYLNDNGPCIPAHVIRGVLMGKGSAARKQKMRDKAELGLFIVKDASLEYDGPRKPLDLWKDESFRFVTREKIGQASIMRTRPIFKNWACEVEIEMNPDFINEDTVDNLMESAGAECGLMERRPAFGRFKVTRKD